VKLVLDWDGTVTVRDTLWMLIDRFGDPDVLADTSRRLGTSFRLRDAIETEMATIAAPLEEAVSFLLDEAEIRAGFAELVERFDPVVLSSGFHETIGPLLAREGVEVDVAANRVDARPDGWRVLWADPTPCPVCGDLCKRRVLPPERPLVYVGDGYSDRCAALASDRVFALHGLADYLVSQDVPFEPFETFEDIAAALA
jgi:2-hydroxy-3-keto-5-methylthiopentenyl-1-phosphate phosphatase